MKPRLLVIELHHLGDAVLSLPFIQAAQAHYEVTVCCRPGVDQIYQLVLPEAQIIVWEPSGKRRVEGIGLRIDLPQLRDLLRQLRQANFDCAVAVWADSRVHTLLALSGAKMRVGFPMTATNYYASEIPWRRTQLRLGKILGIIASTLLLKPLLTHRLNRADYQQSHLTDWQQLAEQLHLPWNTKPPWFCPPEIVLPTAVVDLQCHAKAEGTPLTLLHTGGRLATKRWPLDRFQTVLDSTLTQHNIATVVIAPPDSASLQVSHSTHRLVATTTIAELITVISAVDQVICNDSLVSHLAAALGKPVVAIFGSGNPNWFAPYGSAQRVVRTDCCPHHPCVDRCVMPSPVCLEGVTVTQVIEKLDSERSL